MCVPSCSAALHAYAETPFAHGHTLWLVPWKPLRWFDKVLLGVVAAWLLTIAWFWIVAPSVDAAPNGGRMTCANFPIVKTLTGHTDRPRDQRFQADLESACRSAEDRA